MHDLSLNDIILNYKTSYRLWNQYRKRKKTAHNLQLTYQERTLAVAWGLKALEHKDFPRLIREGNMLFKILNAITPDES